MNESEKEQYLSIIEDTASKTIEVLRKKAQTEVKAEIEQEVQGVTS